MGGDDQVGDFVDFAEGFLGLLDVEGVGEDLAGEEMVLGGDGVAGDQEGGGGEGDQQATIAGGVAGEGKEIDVVGEGVVGDVAGFQEIQLVLEQLVIDVLGGGLMDELLKVLTDELLLGFVEEDFGVLEDGQTGVVSGAEVGQEDGVDLFGAQAGAFEEACGDGGGGQAGIDEDVAFAGADEGGGGMGGSDILRFVPEPIAAEGANTDDVKAKLGHLNKSKGN